MNIMWTADIQMKWRYNHRSCDCDWSNRKLSPKTVFGASRGFEPMASVLALQYSTTELWIPTRWKQANLLNSSYPWKEWNIYYVNCGHTKWNEDVIIAVVGKMNSINWPDPNVWVFIAQLVEHCSANAEAMGSNPVEFSGLICDCLNCYHNCDDYIFISVFHLALFSVMWLCFLVLQ